MTLFSIFVYVWIKKKLENKVYSKNSLCLDEYSSLANKVTVDICTKSDLNYRRRQRGLGRFL